VTAIRTATNTALKPVKTGIGPVAIAITPAGNTAYAVNIGSGRSPGTVTPIRAATNTALTPIRVGTAPVAIAITSATRTTGAVPAGLQPAAASFVSAT